MRVINEIQAIRSFVLLSLHKWNSTCLIKDPEIQVEEEIEEK
jgi:hypothetical protein